MTRAPEKAPDGARALLISDAETARRLGIGKTKARELIATGELRSVRIGRRLLIPVEAVQEFLARLQEAN